MLERHKLNHRIAKFINAMHQHEHLDPWNDRRNQEQIDLFEAEIVSMHSDRTRLHSIRNLCNDKHYFDEIMWITFHNHQLPMYLPMITHEQPELEF